MIRGLKIFRVANIVEIIMMAILFFSMLAVNDFSLKADADIIGLAIVAFLMLAVCWNCISNFLLIRSYRSGSSASLPNVARFWIVAICFLLVSAFLIFCAVISYPVLERVTAEKKSEFYGVLFALFWILFMAANGIYIFIRQIILFNAVKAAGYEESMKLVDEIGRPLE